MQSAFECFNQSAKCEQMADEATDVVDRKALLAKAARWLELGNEATLREADERRKLRSEPL